MPTFDGEALVMTLDAPTNGALTQSVEVDWYSQWKVWQLSGNLRYPPMFFDNSGGETLTTGIKSGAYFRFQNSRGWRIRPFGANQTIYVIGNITADDAALPITVPTVGAFTVMFVGLQPITQNVDSIITTLTDQVTKLQFLLESRSRGSPGYGNVFYWNPVSGVDTATGKNPSTAIKTWAVVEDKLVSGRGDAVIAISSSELTTVNDIIYTAKSNLSIRGPGTSFLLKPTTQTGPTVSIIGGDVTLEGVKISTASGGPYDALSVTGDKAHLKNVSIQNATGRSAVFIGANECVIEDSFLGYAALGGVYIEDCQDMEITNTHLDENGAYNVKCVATSLSSTHEVIINGHTIIHGATANGIDIGVNCDNVQIHGDVKFIENVNDILDSGIATYIEPAIRTAVTILKNKTITNPATGIMTVYKDNGTTPALTAQIYQDANGTQPYTGQGIERREKLA